MAVPPWIDQFVVAAGAVVGKMVVEEELPGVGVGVVPDDVEPDDVEPDVVVEDGVGLEVAVEVDGVPLDEAVELDEANDDAVSAVEVVVVAGAGSGLHADVGVPGKELGTCSTSPGWKVADMTPLPAGWSVKPRTWPNSWRTTVGRSMCWLGPSDGKSTAQPHPAALAEMATDAPLVIPSSSPGRLDEATATQARSDAGTIVSQSAIACAVAADSSASVTLCSTGVEGADAAVESIGFEDELEAEVVDPVELEPDVFEPEVPPVVPEGVVPLDEDVDPSEVEPPVEVLLEDVGEPTVTVWVVVVPLVVVVVVPLFVVVVVVDLLVVETGQVTVLAWITTPGPKLQLLADEGVELPEDLALDPVELEPELEAEEGELGAWAACEVVWVPDPPEVSGWMDTVRDTTGTSLVMVLVMVTVFGIITTFPVDGADTAVVPGAAGGLWAAPPGGLDGGPDDTTVGAAELRALAPADAAIAVAARPKLTKVTNPTSDWSTRCRAFRREP